MPASFTQTSYAYGPLARVLARHLGKFSDAGALVAEPVKRDLLVEIDRRFGSQFIIAVGREVADEIDHPFVRALRAQATPARLLEVWVRLEVLAHSHNRVHVLACSDRTLRLLRCRVDSTEHRTRVDEDLLIIGILQGFFERLGLATVRLDGPVTLPHGNEWQLHFASRPLAPGAPAGVSLWYADGELSRTIVALISSRLVVEEDVDLATIASILGLSSRSLQRHLHAAGTRFSALLRTARVASAGAAIVAENDTTITEIALRLGFADGAHLCRSFREVVGCSPRDLVRAIRR